MIVANPIYDIVFKYLMEDERVARTILSALLKENIVAVKMRPHEYDNIDHDRLSIFRIDFGATVRDEQGEDHLILVELQKTWLPTETLRFRQYLGKQYADATNTYSPDGDDVMPRHRRTYGLPMVTIYLLGHCLGDIEEPVIYVRRQTVDYYDRPVTKGMPNPFVDSLTHDCIIVQIPRLRPVNRQRKASNRLDKVLSIFDQSKADPTQKSQQTLAIDEDIYDDDAEMQRIVTRLVAAAADAKMRHNMNVEDEYFSLIETQDTELMNQRNLLAEQGAQLKEQGVQLKEQGVQLKEQGAQLKEQEAQLKEQGAQLKEQEAQLATSIRLLHQSGMSIQDIAKSMKIDEARIKALL